MTVHKKDKRTDEGTEETIEAKTNPENIAWTRRKFLKRAGATLLVVSVGGILWRAVDQGVFSTGKGPAYELWDVHADEPVTGPLALVQAAILASNPHNSQPWLFRIADTSIELYADEQRNIGSIDPFFREMQMGLGCALENLTLAAQEQGYSPNVRIYPDHSDPTFVAHIDLYPGNKISSPLYHAIPNRRTHRGAYDIDRPVPQAFFDEAEELCQDEPKVKLTWLTTAELKKEAGDLTISATEAITSDPEMSYDSNAWYRDSWQDLQEYRDGITLDAQGGPLWLRIAGKLLPPLSTEQANQFWVNSTRQTHTSTAAAYGLLSIKDFSSKEDRVRAGRVWQRIHLYGTVHGLGLHPLNQPVEMRDRELHLGATPFFGQRLQDLLGLADWDVLFLFRLGYPLAQTHPSPRRALEDVLI
ncbi:Acg family FMN-binding oxidoreductase [Bacillus horti]|uniref:Nitroreductase n=1 Tax=Caldalkalibacillus horti TaxID=77523 RepID=A0ABT9W3B5_9BACI|nr:hypothetical protein [Bacillus horti]MDQ0167727.1 nitroreductase [Bacillus horti]